jgi:Fe-S cluster assembly protein SufD
MAQASRRNVAPDPSFARLFGEVKGHLPGGRTDAVARLREASFERFADQGFPTQRVEAWKYTAVARQANVAMGLAPVSDIGLDALSPHLLGGPKARRLIFVDGHLVPQLCHVQGLPAGAVVRSFGRILEEDPERASAALAAVNDERSFTALNAAFAVSGAWIELADGVVLDEPLQLVFLSKAQPSAMMTHPRCVVRLGAGARLKLIETHGAVGAGHGLTNLVTQIELGRNAQLVHDRLQSLDDASTFIGKIDLAAADGARYVQTISTGGGGLVRNESEVRITGSAVECLLNGLYMPTGVEHVDTLIRIHHLAPGSHSDQFYKGVVDGHGHAAFAGKIIVHQDAQKTNGFQANNNLLLSDDAEIDTKPELEIYADDVKCSHGATVGDLDPTALFYLRSRGLDRATATSMLTWAFAGEVIARFVDPTVKAYATRAALRRLPGGNMLEGLLA